MKNKPALPKNAIMILAVLVVAAIIPGLVFMNKEDQPVAGIVLADRAMESIDGYNAAAEARGDGIYLVVSNTYGQYQAEYEVDVPAGADLYATVRFVNGRQGASYTAKWERDDSVITEETSILPSGPEGVIAYWLNGAAAADGDYEFQLYQEDQIIFAYAFPIGSL